MPITTYPTARDKGLPGGRVNTEAENAVSRTVEDAAGIAFGAPVARGVNDKGCRIMAAGRAFIGVALLNRAVRPGAGDRYAQYDEAGIMDFGVVWVRVNEAVVAGDAAYFNAASGRYTKTNTDIAIPNAIFDANAAAGDVAPLRVRKV